MADGSLPNVAEASHRGVSVDDAVHLRVVVLLQQVAEVEVARLEGHELAVELDVLQVLVEEEAVADAELA
jgi:hypothetical protein